MQTYLLLPLISCFRSWIYKVPTYLVKRICNSLAVQPNIPLNLEVNKTVLSQSISTIFESEKQKYWWGSVIWLNQMSLAFETICANVLKGIYSKKHFFYKLPPNQLFKVLVVKARLARLSDNLDPSSLFPKPISLRPSTMPQTFSCVCWNVGFFY